MSCRYSVVIRTLGNTGEKYRRTLDSILVQTLSPTEIVVAIPDGFPLDHQIGTERIVRCPKGMVTQRIVGIDAANGDYMLVIDDDIEMPPDFVEKMYETLSERNLDCVLAFCDEILKPSLKYTGVLKKCRGAFTGQYFYSGRKSEYYDVITGTAGHRTYVNHPEGMCQTGCFQCFFIKKDAALSVHFQDDRWLEQGSLSTYAAYDDAVFFYKLFLKGGRIAYAINARYIHLDGSAGRKAQSKLDSKRIRLYSIARNRYVFWHKYIYPSRHSAATKFAGLYALVNYTLYSVAVNLWPKYWPAIKALFAGYRDARKCLREQ